MSERGIVFNIQKFCVTDGPGIRTTVFLKGCPLDCLWCHNPESKNSKQEVFYSSQKCVNCGRCAAVCPKGCHLWQNGEHRYLRENCSVCGLCAEGCPTEALELVGKNMTVEEVLKEVLKDRIFYANSGGGMTISGGEPMRQMQFSYELLKAAKEQEIHTCMETSGFGKSEDFQKIASVTDIFLFDYKATDTEKHRKFVGVSNEKILGNLYMLDELGAKIILRCPIIPTCNEDEEHFKGIARTANRLKHILEINLEPYHPLGSGKAAMLGKAYELEGLSFPEPEIMEKWKARIEKETNVPVKIL